MKWLVFACAGVCGWVTVEALIGQVSDAEVWVGMVAAGIGLALTMILGRQARPR